MSASSPPMNAYRRLRAFLHPLRVFLVECATRFRRYAATWRLGYRLGWTQDVHTQNVAFRMIRDGAIPERLRLLGSYEPVETAFLARLFQENVVFIDAGANAGYFSLLAAKMQPTATIHAFEPCSHTFDLLQANIRINRAETIEAHRYALSNTSGTVAMQVNATGLEGLNTLGKPAHYLSKVVGQEMVACLRLDDFLRDRDISHVDALKIDVEGAEFLALEGARELLSQPKAPLVLFELSDLCEKGFGHPVQAILDLFSRSGYRLYTLEHDGLRPLALWNGEEGAAVAVKNWQLGLLSDLLASST